MAKPDRHPPAWLGAAPAMFVGLWATGFIGSRLSAPYAEPLSFLTIRFVIAALVLLVAALLAGAKWPGPQAASWSLINGGLMQGGYLGGVF
ncbi:MAG TPA: EamA/RhaT family transporter, partial [Rhizobiales bacterium]|nr:EamA/RhaT family transporter [Hyphomicrobiales bacterium]